MNHDTGGGSGGQLGELVTRSLQRVDGAAVDNDPDLRFRPFRRQVLQVREHVGPVLLLPGVQHHLEILRHCRGFDWRGILRHRRFANDRGPG
jgi:hypothetical protein